MGVAGGVRQHVASKTNSGDNPRWPFFFSEIIRPWNFGTCFGDFEFKIDEHSDYLLYLLPKNGSGPHIKGEIWKSDGNN